MVGCTGVHGTRSNWSRVSRGLRAVQAEALRHAARNWLKSLAFPVEVERGDKWTAHLSPPLWITPFRLRLAQKPVDGWKLPDT